MQWLPVKKRSTIGIPRPKIARLELNQTGIFLVIYKNFITISDNLRTATDLDNYLGAKISHHYTIRVASVVFEQGAWRTNYL